jgi:hypothetical protein
MEVCYGKYLNPDFIRFCVCRVIYDHCDLCSRKKRDPVEDSPSAVTPPPKPQFTTELEALIAIEANTRQALELLRQ